jgi:hypothetical protein
MFRPLVEFTLAALPPLLFVAYCRSLLRRAFQIELSTEMLKAMAAESARVSAEDFHRLRALVGLCQLGHKDEFPLAAVSIYFSLLALSYVMSLRICGVAPNEIERERQRCSHFVVVSKSSPHWSCCAETAAVAQAHSCATCLRFAERENERRDLLCGHRFRPTSVHFKSRVNGRGVP